MWENRFDEVQSSSLLNITFIMRENLFNARTKSNKDAYDIAYRLVQAWCVEWIDIYAIPSKTCNSHTKSTCIQGIQVWVQYMWTYIVMSLI